jgi:hypothetical protein
VAAPSLRYDASTFERAAQKQEAEDDARGAVTTSNDWLNKDPFALLPMTNLYELLRHGPELVKYKVLDRLPESRHGNPDQLLARVLNVNPDDDLSVKLGIQYAPSFSDARARFERVPPNACARSSLVALLVARFEDAKELAAFAGKAKDDSPGVVLATVQRMVGLDSPSTLHEYLTPSRTSILRQHLERSTMKESAAGQAAVVALALSKLPDRARAREWRDYARRLSPQSGVVESMLKGGGW